MYASWGWLLETGASARATRAIGAFSESNPFSLTVAAI